MNENYMEESYSVRGMSCTGCEGIVEEKLMGMDGVTEVHASFSNRLAAVTFNPAKVNLKRMNRILNASGFTLERIPVTDGNAASSRKEKSFSPLQFLGVVIILLGIYALIDKTVGFNNIPEVSSTMGYGVLFAVGVLTSFHCIAMCGGINMSQCIPNGQTPEGTKSKFIPSLLYNLGRVTSYTIIGGLAGALGSVVSFSGHARGLIAIVAGLFMVVMGISMLGIFPWLNKYTPHLPRFFRTKAGAAGKGKGPYIVGLLNGLMPCGPLQAMQIYALGTGSFLAGAMSMFFFSLGTFPLMFGLGALVTMIGSKFTKKMIKVGAVLVVVLGLIMFSRGFALSGMRVPSFTSLFHPAFSSGSDEASGTTVEVEDGVQNIFSTLEANSYPSFTVQQGIPVVWNLKAEAGSINGCNRTLVLSAYDIQVNLKEGDNIIKFTPTESGSITYSCWMGMITGQIQVIEQDDALVEESTSTNTDIQSIPEETGTIPGVLPGCCG
jgi:sulfite exporter TauE/SafE/copper chaperone CopZ